MVFPGYPISLGTIDPVILSKFNRGFDLELYIIYLLSALIIPFGLILGNLMAGSTYVPVSLNKGFRLRWGLALIFCLVYSFFYFQWLPRIPIFDWVFGADYFQIARSRLLITHGLHSLDPPVLFRYWRHVIQLLFLVLFLIAFGGRLFNGKSPLTIGLASLFFASTFFLVFTFEKAPLIYFLISIYIVFSVVRKGGLVGHRGIVKAFDLKFIFLASILLVVIFLMYHFYMDAGLKSVLNRLGSQTASNYLQIEIVRQLGYSGLSGLGSSLLSLLGVESAINYSKEAILMMYPSYNDAGLSGASGGMFLTNLYFYFGLKAFPLSVFYLVVLGVIDRLFSNSVFHYRNLGSSVVMASFYSIFCVWFSMRALSSPLSFFSADFVFNPALIIFFLIMFIFVSPRLRSA